MKTNAALLKILIPFLFPALLMAQGPTPEWQSIPGINGQFNAIAATADGGMVATGYTYGPLGNADSSAVLGFHYQPGVSGSFYDAWVVKFSASGHVQWGRCYGGDNGNEYGNSICVAPDGGYVIAGSSESTDGDLTHNNSTDLTTSDLWVFKVDTNGAIQWSENFGGPEDEEANGIIPTLDGGYIVSGDSVITGLVIKLDAQGNLQWYTGFGGLTGYTYLQNAIQNADGGYTFGAYSSSNDGELAGDSNVNGDLHFWLFNTDKNGIIQWQKIPEPDITSNQYLWSFIRLKDGGFAMIGYSQPVINGVVYFPEIFVMRTDSAGNYLWSKNYGSSGDDFGYAVVQDTDGNLLAGGYIGSEDTDFAQHTNTAFLLKIGLDSGNIIWFTPYPDEPYHGTTDGTSSFQDLKWASDSGLLAGGEFVKGQWAIDSLITPGAIRPGYAVKFPSPAAAVVTPSAITGASANHIYFSVYPNPASTELRLHISSLVAFPLDVEIVNNLGQSVISQKIFSAQQAISLTNIASGTYTCYVHNSSGYNGAVGFVK
jgi:hypothetical protein